MKRSCLLLVIFLLAGTGLLRADQTTSAVQQALKDQGFFYGDVTGEKNSGYDGGDPALPDPQRTPDHGRD